MYKTIIVFILGFLFVACTDKDEAAKIGCNTPATIRDLTGKDDCEFVFELEDGTILVPEPLFTYMPIPKEPSEDPLSNFDLKDGKKVLIDYRLFQDTRSICMPGTGKIIMLYCISEIAD